MQPSSCSCFEVLQNNKNLFNYLCMIETSIIIRKWKKMTLLIGALWYISPFFFHSYKTQLVRMGEKRRRCIILPFLITALWYIFSSFLYSYQTQLLACMGERRRRCIILPFLITALWYIFSPFLHAYQTQLLWDGGGRRRCIIVPLLITSLWYIFSCMKVSIIYKVPSKLTSCR